MMGELDKQNEKNKNSTASDKVKKDIEDLEQYIQELNQFVEKVGIQEQERIQLFNEFDSEVPEQVRQQR